MFSWKVLWSTALIFTCTPCFLVKSAASAWNCLANVVPLSFVPQVKVPLGLPPPLPPPELLPPPPPQAARVAAAVSPRAPRNSDRRFRTVSRNGVGKREGE